MNQTDELPTSKIAERVIRSRGERTQNEREAARHGGAAYEAFVITPGVPRNAFSLGVYRREVGRLTPEAHGIIYPDLSRPKWRKEGETEYLSFTHAGEAYTLRGRGLYEMYLAIADGTLQSVMEYEASTFAPLEPDVAVIETVTITDVAAMVRQARD